MKVIPKYAKIKIPFISPATNITQKNIQDLEIQIICKQYWIPLCAHSLNAPCPYKKYWPEDGSVEPKHVANYVLMTD